MRSACTLDDTGAQLVLPVRRRIRTTIARRRLPPLLRGLGTVPLEHTTAVSMLDRLLHHATTVVTNGQSYRMRQALNCVEEGELPTP